MAERTPLYMDINSVYSGDELGLPYRDIVSEGVGSPTALAVAQRAAGANLSVDVAVGSGWVLGDTNTDFQPCYRIFNDAVVNKGITPDPSNPRKVLVVAQITDEGFSGVGRQWQIVAIHGTPAASPTEPALPASALPLALIDVTTADTDITTAQITDRRYRAGFGDKALLWSKSLAAAAASLDTPGTIPQGFTHLELVLYARGDAAAVNTDVRLKINGDVTSGNYLWQYILGAATGVTAAEVVSAGTYARVAEMPANTAAANRFGTARILIPCYGEAKRKSYEADSVSPDAGTTGTIRTFKHSGVWEGTAAITALSLIPGAGNFAPGTRVSLYGIKG